MKRSLVAALCAGVMAVVSPVVMAAPLTFSAGEGVAAGGSWTTPFRPAAPRVYQWVLPASVINYAGTDAVELTGLQFRLSHQSTEVGVTALNSGGSVGNFEVVLSRLATGVTELNTTFANNIRPGTAITVRSGELVLPANGFPARSAATDPGGFGTVIGFSTPYIYNPGEEILVTLRHTGFTFVDPQEGATPATDSFNSGGFGVIANTTSATATSGSRFIGTNATVTQFTFIPEPASLGLLTAGGLLLVRRRAQR